MIGNGIAAAFRADQTPPFWEHGGSFLASQTDGNQAGLLNQHLGAVNPLMLSELAGGIEGRILDGSGTAGSSPPTVASAQASQLRQIRSSNRNPRAGSIRASSSG